MVSDELRNFKPYAIPVRVLKYTSLTDKNARDLKDELKNAMEDMGMVTVGMFNLYTVPVHMLNFLQFFLNTAICMCNYVCNSGFVTDGEFNSLRTQGSKRPVSVIQLIMDAKNEARAIPSRDIEKFFKTIKKGSVHMY